MPAATLVPPSPGPCIWVRQCAWCRRVLGRAGGAPAGAVVSHGICARCERAYFPTATTPTPDRGTARV